MTDTVKRGSVIRYRVNGGDEIRTAKVSEYHEYWKDDEPGFVGEVCDPLTCRPVRPKVACWGRAKDIVEVMPAGRRAQEDGAAQDMVIRLAQAGIHNQAAAVALSIDERDQILRVAAWGGTEDAAWARALQMLDAL